MKTLGKLAMGGILAVSTVVFAAEVTGAGSTFAYPMISAWAFMYEKATGIKVNYQSIGSGGGIRQIENRTVDFGASDAPLTPDELNKKRLLQFPIIIGGVVMVYNLPELQGKQLNFDGAAICNIYLGKIKKWNDPYLRQLNPGVNLPDRDITVVRRSDGSGTTWIFTNYLSKVCPEWQNKVGYGTSVNWPIGIGGKGNEGVANYVRRMRGAIGYVEYIYAKQNNMIPARVKNREGNFVAPSPESFQAAAANAKWDKKQHFYYVLTDQPGKDSYPISGATFVLLAKDRPESSKKAVQFFDWAFKNGDKEALRLNYIPMPQNVKNLIREYWKENGLM
ncbi:MAG TPA: phosphate ABC transporter substrate-binding protein PstS [Sulfurihydrogenibium azorense]|uniref:Phosphate-binding protein n=1 Tax=Sulfurihydrogenibium azorense TaxID=309806 RepID=A0A831YAP9_9AQUI|nr:MAG: phosphate ABC transporter substrate-binding protein PstS [Sulfurihydrogenibium sp.]HEV08952.1 phosphate ABC transporter substrate-binding protein PstS [Sulfurihydrogenibium azorense]